MTTKMNRDELTDGLKRHNMTAAEACTMIFNDTGAVISAKRINENVERYGLLSATQTAIFRYLFKRLDQCRSA